jgi:hypothetical protein
MGATIDRVTRDERYARMLRRFRQEGSGPPHSTLKAMSDEELQAEIDEAKAIEEIFSTESHEGQRALMTRQWISREQSARRINRQGLAGVKAS